MDKLVNTLKSFFIGRVTRGEFITRAIVATLLCTTPSLVLVLMMTFFSEQYVNFATENIAISLVIQFLQLIPIFILMPYIMGLNLKRARDLLSSSSNPEIYTFFALSIIISYMIPIFGLVMFFLYVFAKDGFDQTEFYQKYLKNVLLKVVGLFSKEPEPKRVD